MYEDDNLSVVFDSNSASHKALTISLNADATKNESNYKDNPCNRLYQDQAKQLFFTKGQARQLFVSRSKESKNNELHQTQARPSSELSLQEFGHGATPWKPQFSLTTLKGWRTSNFPERSCHGGCSNRYKESG